MGDDLAMDFPTEGALPAMELSPGSSATKSKKKGREERRKRMAKWTNEREMPSQLVGVVRHTERADSCWNAADSLAWQNTPDFEQWPKDPPLSQNGVKAAQEIGKTVLDWANECESIVHVVISSPYLRCIQTAAEIADKLGDGTRLLVDKSLGEVYGPSIMGEYEPLHATRTAEEAQSYLKRCGLHCKWEVIGTWPTWGETLRAARWRFASRFLKHLQRSLKVRRNCVLVSHGECVAATLSILPSQVESGSQVEKVDFGGMFLARRSVVDEFLRDSRCASGSASWSASWTPEQYQSLAYPRSRGQSMTASAASSEFRSALSSNPLRRPSFLMTSAPCSAPRQEDRVSISTPRLSYACTTPRSRTQTQADNEWDVADERAEDSAAVFAHGEDTDETPAFSVGWQVLIRNVDIHQEELDDDKALEKKMRFLEEKSSYTAEQLKLLLGKLSDQPLSLDHPKGKEEDEDEEFFVRPVLSGKSTFLFGASNADLSLIDRKLRTGSSGSTCLQSSSSNLQEKLSSPGKKHKLENAEVPTNGTNPKDVANSKASAFPAKVPTLLPTGLNSKIGLRRKKDVSSPSS